MKQLVPIVLALFFLPNSFYAQQATNFNVPDCSGDYYELFEHLDSGKVVVIGWTMPCPPCILPLLTTHNVVKSYQSSHPGQVEMLLADDYGDTPCSSIILWGNNNGMKDTRKFSDPAIKMMDYGSDGMPKVVVIGPNRNVYYNADDYVDHNELIAAINLALTTVSVSETANRKSGISVFPNPVASQATITLQLTTQYDITLRLLNLFGQEVSVIYSGSLHKQSSQFELSTTNLNPGLYFIHLQYEGGSNMHKISVVK